MPFSVRCYITGLVAMVVSVIATVPLSAVRPVTLAALCALVVAAERFSRVRIGTSSWTMSISLVATIIGVLVLAPPEAALLGLVTSVTAPRAPTWTRAKQTLNSGISALVPASGAAVCYLTGGHEVGHFLIYPDFLWPFAAAVSTCLVVNSLIIAGYTALAGPSRFVDVLRSGIKRASMPYYSSAMLSLTFLSLWNEIGWYTAPLVVVPMYIAHWSLSQYAREEAAHEGTIAALVQAVEIKDSYTRGHSERVARGAEMLAQQLKMPAARLAMLRFAGLLHDIGKLGVPTRLLTSTGGLTEEEFKLLCLHPNHGVAVLRDIRFLTEVYEGVLYHHERLDGRGYPTGKSGDQIPQFARIIGVADAFDAMTSTRSYRAARSVEEAVAELRRGAGTQFDPVLVEAFEQALKVAERSGQPWVPTELALAEPRPEDEAAAAATGPWPLPKRVPGFSFADHDDPFVPVEWYSAWYPRGLAPDAADGPEADGADADGADADGAAGVRPGAERLGAIPGQRVAEPPVEPEPRDQDGGGSHVRDSDLDDGWSERMYSAVVREPGPEADEGWDWDAEAGSGAETVLDDETALGGSAGQGPAAGPDRGPTPGAAPSADAAPADSASADSARWPVDPGLRGDPRGSMRVRATTPAVEADPRGPTADAGAAKPVASCQESPFSGLEPADDAAGTGPLPPLSVLPLPKLGDPEAWTPSPEPWAAPETRAEAPKVADPAEPPAEADGHATPPGGPSWFARGAAAPSGTRHFFGAGEPGSWASDDPDAKDSEAEDAKPEDLKPENSKPEELEAEDSAAEDVTARDSEAEEPEESPA